MQIETDTRAHIHNRSDRIKQRGGLLVVVELQILYYRPTILPLPLFVHYDGICDVFVDVRTHRHRNATLILCDFVIFVNNILVFFSSTQSTFEVSHIKLNRCRRIGKTTILLDFATILCSKHINSIQWFCCSRIVIYFNVYSHAPSKEKNIPSILWCFFLLRQFIRY